MSQNLQRDLVAPSWAACSIQARYRFDVVIVDIDRGTDDSLDARQGTLEIGHQDFDSGAWRRFLYRKRGSSEVRGTTVAQVVSVYRGHHHMLQAKPADRLCDAAWFVRIQRAHTA